MTEEEEISINTDIYYNMYVCPIHGEMKYAQHVDIEGHNEYYCLACYVENVIKPNCCVVKQKN